MSEDVESDYEYEYSTTETETFLIDLDFSSVNGIIKSKNSGDRKILRAPTNTAGASNTTGKRKKLQKGKGKEVDRHVDEQVQTAADGAAEQDPSVVHQTGESPAANNADNIEDFGDSIQILDLHTSNPIISYRNAIYSCRWTDMIGTNMFFTKHLDTPTHEPEIATEDYDLVGTSRIKLVGHRAIITSNPDAGPSSSSTRKRPRPQDDNSDSDSSTTSSPPLTSRSDFSHTSSVSKFLPQGRSLGNIKRTNPRVNIEIKQQASFLERLMTLKQQRGDADTVRTYVDHHILAAEQKRDKEADEMRSEIDELNRRVVQGDNEALERLQDIYDQMEGGGGGGDVENGDVDVDGEPSGDRGKDEGGRNESSTVTPAVTMD